MDVVILLQAACKSGLPIDKLSEASDEVYMYMYMWKSRSAQASRGRRESPDIWKVAQRRVWDHRITRVDGCMERLRKKYRMEAER